MASPGADGLLLVDKTAGVTSHDVVATARRALRTSRIGHAGTLDPFATGLLVLLVGRATRLLPYLDGEPKRYAATIRFGAETDTGDTEGVVTAEAAPPDERAIRAAVAQLTGAIDQVPPAHSAKLVQGERAYAKARRGETVTLAPVRVRVHAWDVGARCGADLTVTITCSGGTYVRALARDLGRLAGSAAHLTALRRLDSGPFSVERAHSIDALRDGSARMLAPRAGVASLPAVEIDDATIVAITRGQSVPCDAPSASRVAMVDAVGTLVSIADRVGDRWQPRLVLRDA